MQLQVEARVGQESGTWLLKTGSDVKDLIHTGYGNRKHQREAEEDQERGRSPGIIDEQTTRNLQSYSDASNVEDDGDAEKSPRRRLLRRVSWRTWIGRGKECMVDFLPPMKSWISLEAVEEPLVLACCWFRETAPGSGEKASV